MNETISRINYSIDEKKNQLSKMVDEDFDRIFSYLSEFGANKDLQVNKVNSRGISTFLYAGSAVSTTGAVVTKLTNLYRQKKTANSNQKNNAKGLTKTLSLVAMILAAAGLVVSRFNNSTTTLPPSSDPVALKNEVISRGIAAVKQVTREWEDFMETSQQEMYEAIETSSLTAEQKDSLCSKIFSYEVIDVNLSDLMETINSATSIPLISDNLKHFNSKLLTSIDKAINAQKAIYNSLKDYNA